jgi:hypothetical protein
MVSSPNPSTQLIEIRKSISNEELKINDFPKRPSDMFEDYSNSNDDPDFAEEESKELMGPE